MQEESAGIAADIINGVGSRRQRILDAQMLEDAIFLRNLQHEYSIILVSIVRESWHLHGWRSWEDTWALIRATPEQRAQAFLKVVKQ